MNKKIFGNIINFVNVYQIKRKVKPAPIKKIKTIFQQYEMFLLQNTFNFITDLFI